MDKKLVEKFKKELGNKVEIDGKKYTVIGIDTDDANVPFLLHCEDHSGHTGFRKTVVYQDGFDNARTRGCHCRWICVEDYYGNEVE